MRIASSIGVVAVLMSGCSGGCSRRTSASSSQDPTTLSSPAPAASASSSDAGARETAEPHRATAPKGECRRDATFPATIELPEASAAAEVELTPNVRELAVLSDGHHGKVWLWKLPSGPARSLHSSISTQRQAKTSKGQPGRAGSCTRSRRPGPTARSFHGAGGLRREGSATPIGPPPWSCARLDDKQCGSNYEGLCLRPTPIAGACAGYAASKKRGQLDCVRFEGAKLVVDPKVVLPLGVPKHALSDCAFGAKGSPLENALFVTTNSKGASTSFTIDEATGAAHRVGLSGTTSNEAIATDREGALYVFADAHQKQSEGIRAACDF